MASNHKHSCTNGLSSSFNLNEAKKELLRGKAKSRRLKRGFLLLVVLFLLVWVLTCLFGWKVKGPVGNEDRTNHSSENCYLIAEKIASLESCQQSGNGISQISTVACALKMLGSEDQVFHRQSDLMTENSGLSVSCPSIENTNVNHIDLLSAEEASASTILNFTFLLITRPPLCYKENKVQMRELHARTTDLFENICLRFAKIVLCILIGVAASYCLRKLYAQHRSQKHETIQKQPLLQHPQFQPHAQYLSGSTGKWRKKLLVIFVLGGIIFSIWLFWYLNKDIMLRRKETLASMCDERARMLQDQFNVSMNHVHALAILISTFHHGKQPSAIDQKTFEDYTERTAFERPLTSGVAYALRVRHSEREHVEKQYGWAIKKMNIEDQTLAQDYHPENFHISPVQDEYAPVIFSQKTVSHIVSIDMMSGKEDRENILRARASGKGVLTSPFKLLKSNYLGVVLTFAVYNTSLPPNATPVQRINATVGYLGASYDVQSLVKKLLHQLASKQTIIVNVYDTTSEVSPIQMFGTDVADWGLLHISHLDFGDPTRKHEMHCRFKTKPPPPWQAIIASSGALVITLLLGHIFYAAINQIAKVERDYHEMMELKHRAEAADVAKSQFLATVSHEIRTPMNGVLGMLQMLMDTNLDPCQLNYAETAYDSGKDLISLINKVLDQAKIESGRLELEAVPFDLRAVLDKVLSIFSGKSREKGIELAVYVSEKVPAVVIGDQERFGQIITNLVGNSIKFTHEKGHIFVSVHLVDEVSFPLDVKDEVLRRSLAALQNDLYAPFDTLSGCRVVDRRRSWENFENLSGTAEEAGKVELLVTVEDTGTGIPPEAQDRIFTPFMQADSSMSRKYGGTGIGLSISKRLVHLMGGEIGFVSEVNTGSTFSFSVNFNQTETNSVDRMREPCDLAVSEFCGLRALVVDDKRIRAEVTKYHIQRLGMDVDITCSLESACSYVSNSCKASTWESGNFTMVLIDQEIWDEETWFPWHDLIKAVRNDGSRCKSGSPLKIYMLVTCISSNDCIKLKLDNLVDGLIPKPLRLNALISAFLEATDKRLDTRDKPSTLTSLLKGKQILVVDDNSVNRRVVEGALRKYGAVVWCVEGGKLAVDLLKPPHKFDACLMDLQMPEMDGFEATRQIRNHEKKYNEEIGSAEMVAMWSHWHTPILAMTADVMHSTNEDCLKCGMDDYVSKPFGEGQLYSAVARFFDLKQDKLYSMYSDNHEVEMWN